MSNPAKVPRKYWNKPLTVEDLFSGEKAYIELNGLYIDEEWGVWVDPRATIIPVQDGPPPSPKLVAIEKKPDGLVVRLSVNENSFKGKLARSDRSDFRSEDYIEAYDVE